MMNDYSDPIGDRDKMILEQGREITVILAEVEKLIRERDKWEDVYRGALVMIDSLRKEMQEMQESVKRRGVDEWKAIIKERDILQTELNEARKRLSSEEKWTNEIEADRNGLRDELEKLKAGSSG